MAAHVVSRDRDAHAPDNGPLLRYIQPMIRRVLAFLVVLAMAVPSLGVAAAGVAVSMAGVSQAATCECPPTGAASDCSDRSTDCASTAECLARCVVTGPSLGGPSSIHMAAVMPHAALHAARSIAPPDVPTGPPFRPPR